MPRTAPCHCTVHQRMRYQSSFFHAISMLPWRFFGSCYRVEYHHPNQNNFFVKSPNDCLKLTASLTMLTKSSFTTLPMSWKVTEIRFELRPAIWLMAKPFLMWHSQQSHYFFICIRASVDSVAGVECKKCNKMKGWAHLEFIAADTAFT